MIFFTNGKRAYHTGIVVEITSTRVKTIEGNTSGASGVVENGGGVCRKSYSCTDSKILGYGLPSWSKLGKSGWQQENGGWRFYLDNDHCVVNDWYEDEGRCGGLGWRNRSL